MTSRSSSVFHPCQAHTLQEMNEVSLSLPKKQLKEFVVNNKMFECSENKTELQTILPSPKVRKCPFLEPLSHEVSAEIPDMSFILCNGPALERCVQTISASCCICVNRRAIQSVTHVNGLQGSELVDLLPCILILQSNLALQNNSFHVLSGFDVDQRVVTIVLKHCKDSTQLHINMALNFCIKLK